jgi:hypothetical protein
MMAPEQMAKVIRISPSDIIRHVRYDMREPRATGEVGASVHLSASWGQILGLGV